MKTLKQSTIGANPNRYDGSVMPAFDVVTPVPGIVGIFVGHLIVCRRYRPAAEPRLAPPGWRVRLAILVAMRFRISHLLASMVFVALWAPLSQWLLVLEAKDHPWKPQETVDVIAFYAGSAAMVGAVMVIPWIVIRERRRREARAAFNEAQALAAQMRDLHASAAVEEANRRHPRSHT